MPQTGSPRNQVKPNVTRVCVCLGKRAYNWVWQDRVLRRGSLEARAYRSGVGTQVSWGRKDNSFVCCVSLIPSPMHRCVGCKRSLLHQWTHGLMQLGIDMRGLSGVDNRSLLYGPNGFHSQHSGFVWGLISLGVTPRTNTARAAIFPPREAWGPQRPFWEAKGGPRGPRPWGFEKQEDSCSPRVFPSLVPMWGAPWTRFPAVPAFLPPPYTPITR